MIVTQSDIYIYIYIYIHIAIIILYNAHLSLQELSCVQMLLELLGLNRANSCVWCNVSKDQRQVAIVTQN